MLIQDIINEIASYLFGINLINLSLTSKQNIKLLHCHMCNQIDKKLNFIFGENHNDFKKIFNNTFSCLSGSFILECLLDTKYDDADLDIYVPILSNDITYTDFSNMKTQMDDFIHNQLNGLWVNYNDVERYDFGEKTKISFIRDYILFTPIFNDDEDDIDIKNCYYELQKFINECTHDARSRNHFTKKYITKSGSSYKDDNFKLFNFTYQIKKIQVILVHVDKNNLIQFINDEYDFDICKNVYYYKDNKPILYINNLQNVINKQTQFNYTIDKDKSELRRLKYEMRGITFL